MPATTERTAADRVRACREAARRHDPKLRAIITDLGDAAEREAEAREGGDGAASGGLLDGQPVAVKDNIDVAGAPTTVGRPGPGTVASADAPVVARLRAAGAIVVSKTNLHELAFGATTQNPHHGTCRNPWDPTRLAGGSSGGSAAAVAAGMCEVALGSDTGGSVRIPAALTGCVGLRPTTGAVPSGGTVPLSPRFDVVSPIARRVADLAPVWEAIAGYDAEDPTSRRRPAGADTGKAPADGAGRGRPLAGLRVGVHRPHFFDTSDPEVAEAVLAAVEVLASLGAEVADIAIAGAAETQARMIPLFYTESAHLHLDAEGRAPADIGADVRARLEIGWRTSGVEVAACIAWQRAWRRRVERTFADVDVIVTPTVPLVAPAADEDSLATTGRLTSLTCAWALAGVPALSVPCGFAEGLPVGLQLAAAPWREALLVSVGAAYEAATGWDRLQPPLTDASAAPDDDKEP